jgi:hypothetical protein
VRLRDYNRAQALRPQQVVLKRKMRIEIGLALRCQVDRMSLKLLIYLKNNP